MGRNKETGLSYFPFDVDMFQDIKVRKLIKYQGGKAVTVYALLLCIIYKGGYYMRWDEELPFIVSEQTGFEEAYIREVIKSCMALGLFSKEAFDNWGVLTSAGIQERYQTISRSLRRVVKIEKYSLFSSEENVISSAKMHISSEEKGISSEEMPISSAETPIKGNRIEENKKENVKEKTTRFSFHPPTLSEIQDYCRERNNSVDPERFYNFYQSKGWMVGKNKMKDWKAAVRTWERSENKPNRNAYGTHKQGTTKEQRDEEFARHIAEKLGTGHNR